MTQRKISRNRSDDTVWLYGTHSVVAALNNPKRQAKQLLVSGPIPSQLKLDHHKDLTVKHVTRREIDSLLPKRVAHQGLLLKVSNLPGISIDIVTESHSPQIVIVLDRITDPRNVGAILRSAAAFGVKAVICTKRHAPPSTGTLAKAAAGGLEIVPLIRVTNLARTLSALKNAEFRVIGLDPEAPETLRKVLSDEPDMLVNNIALVLGAEGHGLRRLTTRHCDVLVKVPIATAVASLNVSNAAAIALYAISQH